MVKSSSSFPLLIIILLFNNIVFASAWLLNPKKHEFIFQNEYKILTTLYKEEAENETYASKVFHLQYYDLFYRYGLNKKYNLGFDIKWFNYLGSEPIYLNQTSEYEFYEYNELILDSALSKYSNIPLETQIFLQSIFWSGSNFIISLKPNITFYASKMDSSIGNSILYGYGFKIGKRNGFINIGIGADVYKGTSISEKYNLTLGFELTKKYLVMLQSFNRENSDYFYPNSNEVCILQ